MTGGDLAKVAIPVRLFVAPSHRGSGVGKQLMHTVQGYADQHGLTVVFDVMEKDRIAIQLYEALGCQRIGTLQHRHGRGQTEPAAVYTAMTKGFPGPESQSS